MKKEDMTREEKEFARKVGERMRQIRHSCKLTQMQVYVQTSVTPNTISNYEFGERTPSLCRMYRLAKCYGCKVSDFVEGVV